jgi:hypothetical protein
MNGFSETGKNRSSIPAPSPDYNSFTTQEFATVTAGKSRRFRG